MFDRKAWTDSYNHHYYERNRSSVIDKGARHRARVKLDVMSYYGRNGKAQCTWTGCVVDDIDMLTLDHIHDNDGEQRGSTLRSRIGSKLYSYLRRNNYPDGFQTLCANHQMKKEALRKRRASKLFTMFDRFLKEIRAA